MRKEKKLKRGINDIIFGLAVCIPLLFFICNKGFSNVELLLTYANFDQFTFLFKYEDPINLPIWYTNIDVDKSKDIKKLQLLFRLYRG